MSTFLKEFKFEKIQPKITYNDEEPLKLNKDFTFFHNKSKFRKELNRLQYLFKTYTQVPLHAAGIRDSYLKEEYSEEYLMILFTTSNIIKKTNDIIEPKTSIKINPGCFYLESNTDFMLLLSHDMDGLILGIDTLETILKQVMEDYTNQKRFDDYIKIRPFRLTNCNKPLA